MKKQLTGIAAAAVVAIAAAVLIPHVGSLATTTPTPTTPQAAPTPVAEPVPSSPPTTPSPIADDAAVEYAQAAVHAAALSVIDPSAWIPDYRREEFGPRWPDLDGDGCNERQEVLQRDLDNVVLAADGCRVLTGTLHDPYTGTTILFQHDEVADPGNPGSQGVPIDHIISLAQAWRGGAWAWSDEQRIEFANDLDGLIAVDGSANSGKGDSGPSSWLPPNPSYVCPYALQVTQIATQWQIAVTPDDQATLVDVLTTCANE